MNLTEQELEALVTRVKLDLFIFLQEGSSILTKYDVEEALNGSITAKELLGRMLFIQTKSELLQPGQFTWDSYLADAIKEFPEYYKFKIEIKRNSNLYVCNVCSHQADKEQFNVTEDNEMNCPLCNSINVDKVEY